MSEVINSPAVFEAKDYFEVIKSTKSVITDDEISNVLANLVEEYKSAKMINQAKLAGRLKFYIQSTVKQLNLIGTPYTKYVASSTISEYINKVQPKNSVKIVELERYCRIIPKENAKAIHEAISKNIFDDILILYTDLTNQRNETKEEKAVIARNRDPIAFGVFRDKNLEISNPHFFIITEWIDEWCDLTFDKLISECVKYNVEEKHGVVVSSNAAKAKLLAECKDIIDVHV